MADLELGVSAVGVDQVVSDLAKVDKAQDKIAVNAQSASRQTQAASRASARSFEDLGRAATLATARAIDFTTKLSGAANAVQSLAGQLGVQGGAAGLIGSIAGTSASMAQLGAMAGPQGALVGGIVGALIPAMTAAASALGDLDRAASQSVAANVRLERSNEELASSYQTILANMRAVARERSQQERLGMGLGTAEEQEALVRTRREELERLEAMLRGYDSTLGDGNASLGARSAASRLREQVRPLIRAARASLDEAMSAQRQAGEDLAADAEEMFESLVDSARRAGEQIRGAVRGGSGPAAPDPIVGRIRGVVDRVLDGPAPSRDVDPSADERIDAIGDSGLDSFLAGAAREGADAMREAADAARALERAQADLKATADEAYTAFATGWTDSLEQVRESWEEANRAAQAAGTGMISRGRLMERSLVAVGNNIAETVGGTMKGAFEDALGAWLDGSKSFVEAAEEMVHGVIKALTIESIVQAVAEIARGIAALAGGRYDAAPQHFAAAAAWGAVAGVAGAVGAGIGSFGGGGQQQGASGGGDSRALAAGSVQERERTENITINVYPGQIYSTADQLNNAVFDAVDGAIRMSGRRIDPRGLPRGR